MIRILTFLLAVFFLEGCNHHQKNNEFIPEAPQYQDSALWYISDKGKQADVFYITPTCIFDWVEDQSGLPCHYYDVYGKKMKENFSYSLDLANEIFGKDCNFYAPYYRQISLDSWITNDSIVNERFKLAMEDISQAFKYYLQHQNNGNPFVLAGYSQGGKAVVELVKSLDQKTLQQMKAAYSIGYQLTESDLKHPNIHPATCNNDQGVIISYNSVKSLDHIWPIISGSSKACINPVNWRTDSTSVQLNDTISVHIDPEHQVLIVNGYNDGGVNIPLLNGTILPGNYHLSELTLYKKCLQNNIKERIR